MGCGKAARGKGKGNINPFHSVLLSQLIGVQHVGMVFGLQPSVLGTSGPMSSHLFDVFVHASLITA